jgi:WD40 repeat protein
MSLFHLRLETAAGARAGGPYRVGARAPDGIELSGPFPLPWPDSQLDDLLDERLPHAVLAAAVNARRVIPAEEVVVQRVGGGLFDALPEDVRALLTESLRRAERAGNPLTVALRAEPPELGRLPWELLYLRDHDDYPFLHHHLVRELPIGLAGLPLRVRDRLRVLAMVGHPKGLQPEHERKAIRQALAPLEEAGQVMLEWVPGHSWQALKEAVESTDWHIVHFVGHGTFDPESREGAVQLEDDQDHPLPVPGSRLADLLRGQPSIRLVVLNSCHGARSDARDRFSSVAAALLRRGIPAVVAMQFEITDRAAIEFSRSFYGGLARQRSVEASVTAFRKDVRIALPGSLEYGTPALYMDTPGRPVFDVWRPLRVTTIAAPAPVNAVAFSPDGRRLVLACDGRAPWLLPTSAWDGPRPARAFAKTPYAVAFHPRDGWFATAHRDRAVRRWYSDSGTQMAAPIRHPDWVGEVAFSPDGTLLATAGGDGTVRLWEVGTGTGRLPEWKLLPHPDPVRSVAFHGDRIATACDDGSARIWTMDAEAQLTITHHAPVIGVALSPDGRLLATACDDGFARTWRAHPGDTAAGRPVPVGEFPHRAGVLSVAFSPDGRWLATAGRDHTTRVWETATSEQLALIDHAGPVRRVVFSPDGRWLATAGYDRACQVWQVTKPASIEAWIDVNISNKDATELQESLVAMRVVPGALGLAVPARRSIGLDSWLVLIVVPLTAFLAAIGTRLGNAAFEWLVRVIRKLQDEHRAGSRKRPWRLQDADTGVVIVLEADLPDKAYRQLRDVDPTWFRPGETVRYDRDRGEWPAGEDTDDAGPDPAGADR